MTGGAELGHKEAIVLDMEASLEHMRRGTVRHVDTLLIVTEPYFRALETASRLASLAGELEIPDVTLIANQVRSTLEESAVREFAERHGMSIAAVVPFDPEVTRVDNLGQALLDAAPLAEAAQQVALLAGRLDRQFTGAGA